VLVLALAKTYSQRAIFEESYAQAGALEQLKPEKRQVMHNF
jgi:hypothetical protein